MKTDAELVREFVETHAEPAFAELVNRHINLVYSAARYATGGDDAAAQDVTQLVFIELARKAARLTRYPTLAGWLYTCARYASGQLRRSEQRRIAREEEAHHMNELLQPAAPADPAWEELRPVLNEALDKLNEPDRNAVLLRFFEGKNLREVGEALCLSENAARMRVDRALEKLRKLLARRGIHSTSSALTASLAAGFVAPPPSLAATVTASALAATTASTASTATLFGIMTMTKFQIATVSALVVAAVTVSVWQQWRYQRLAREYDAAPNSQLELIAQLRQENQRLSDALRAADGRAQEEHLELLRYRGEAAVARRMGEEPDEVKPKREENGFKNEPWWQRFEAAYKLRDSEVLRRVSKPFIPERDEYWQRRFGGPGGMASSSPEGPDFFAFGQNEQGLLRGPGLAFIGGNPKLTAVLSVVGLKRYEYGGADELLALRVAGDWVIREGASIESRLAALEPILRDATGRNIHFEKQAVENDVIVARGSFAPGKEYQRIDVFAEKKDETEAAGGGSGDFQKFLEALGNHLNIAFANEAQLQNEVPVSWFWSFDSKYSRAGDRREELLYKTLENLHQQTSLTFELQRRPTEVWVVQEK